MIIRRVLATLAVAVGHHGRHGLLGAAQEPAAPKDEALDSLLEKLSEPSAKADQKSPKSTPSRKDEPAAKKTDPAAKDKQADAGKPDAGRPSAPFGQAGAKDGKSPASKPDGAAPSTGKTRKSTSC